jgi:hypothetical protein
MSCYAFRRRARQGAGGNHFKYESKLIDYRGREDKRIGLFLIFKEGEGETLLGVIAFVGDRKLEAHQAVKQPRVWHVAVLFFTVMTRSRGREWPTNYVFQRTSDVVRVRGSTKKVVLRRPEEKLG